MSNLLLNKRGQELSTNAIILIVLGVIVLVILILGFTIGWDKILPFVKQTNNVQDIQTACDLACTTANTYNYCTTTRTLKAEDLPGGKTEVTNTCKFFSSDANYVKYGIKTCSAVTCGT